MSQQATAQHFELIDLHPAPTDVTKAVLEGLCHTPKQLPAWLLYDRRGSALFDAICQQPEYTLTRLEKGLLEAQALAIAEVLPPGSLIVEFGAGSAEKVSPLLEAIAKPSYLAIDISAEHLQQAGHRLQERHLDVPMLGICADYSQPLELPLPDAWASKPMVGFFPGSSLGNFEPEAAISFLTRMRELLGEGSQLLIGIDQPRQPALLEAAYNDAAGVTAEFNLNLLGRINRELGAEFDVDAFSHQANYDEKNHRVDIRLVSQCHQAVKLDGHTFRFEEGETIHTEYSHKYTIDSFADLASEAGFVLRASWTDADDNFAVLHLVIQ